MNKSKKKGEGGRWTTGFRGNHTTPVSVKDELTVPEGILGHRGEVGFSDEDLTSGDLFIHG